MTHPAQYLAPWFRFIAANCPELDLTVLYATQPTPAQQGVGFGKAFASALNKPFIAVNHLEGHALSPKLNSSLNYPYLLLLISGGHSQFLNVQGLGKYKRLGTTIDDALGEAFDKTAKLLDLEYPGGPRLAAMAESGNIERFTFPRPMTDRPGLEFSFSGLKTYTRNLIEKNRGDDVLPDDQTMADICAGFQEAVVDTLVIKCRRAMQQTSMKTLVIAGGVSANLRLRKKLEVALG